MTHNLRDYARQTNTRLFFGFIVLVLFLGGGLIYWLYGKGAAVLSLVCIVAGLIPLLLIWIVMHTLDWIAKKADE